MADMELVIKIPEHAYEECKKAKLTEALEGVPFHVMKAIANGTPLPKGHGRLVDANALICEDETCIELTKNAPTIIEANKTESEEV